MSIHSVIPTSKPIKTFFCKYWNCYELLCRGCLVLFKPNLTRVKQSSLRLNRLEVKSPSKKLTFVTKKYFMSCLLAIILEFLFLKCNLEFSLNALTFSTLKTFHSFLNVLNQKEQMSPFGFSSKPIFFVSFLNEFDCNAYFTFSVLLKFMTKYCLNTKNGGVFKLVIAWCVNSLSYSH